MLSANGHDVGVPSMTPVWRDGQIVKSSARAGEASVMPSAAMAAVMPPMRVFFMVCSPSRDVSLVNRHDGLVGVVFVVCLACVVFAGGVDCPRDVWAIPAFADDDENVVHLAVVEPCPALLDPGGGEAVRLGGVQRDGGRDLMAAVATVGFSHKGSLPSVGHAPAIVGNKRQ